MPIVNGTYVPDNLGSDQVNIQKQAFGPEWKPTRKDMSDYSAAAYNYMMKQQEQAYNLELWNLQNEYNTPAAQMARYQDAGLNPNLIYSKDNMASSPAAASAAQFRPQGAHARSVAQAASMINQIVNVVKTARDTFDYMKYGREQHAWENNLLIQRGQAQANENLWNDYLLGRLHPETAAAIALSPKGSMYEYQKETARMNYERLVAICKMIPDQQARLNALRQLDEKRGEIMNGQYDFILHGFDTGNETLNSFLRMFMMFGMPSLF